ncbi:structural maintenance of chromosomes protein 4 [Chironomus tepperi]|uniref:structural maintenance of chromosomes protein 4 n=1 Tax=Chironomus tepperi TaxID=113505 RepID=UPI00391F5A35
MSNAKKRKAEEELERNEPADDDMDFSEDEEGGTRVGGIYIPPPVKAYCSAESKGPRLVITHIENTNFKSYANTVSVGPFHHRFSAVIGPNGSGKSNVIDSMLFVFGYRAQQIRSKKLSVLIHNSSKYPNINQCKVAVHFKQIIDKDDGTYEFVPNSEIVVARTAFKNNSSYYTINGKEYKFKEVAKLLETHGIDLLHNRFLILQGEVESIAMMKAKAQAPNETGLLEYLEDIIGTERYKKPLTQINERLEKLNEERTEKHNRCRLAEREMKDLELPMTQAVEYLKLENKLYQAQNLHLQLYISHKKQEIQKYEEEKKEAAEVLKEHDNKFEEIKKQRQEKEKIIHDEMKKYEELQGKIEEFKSMEAKARDKHQRVDAKMRETNTRRKDLKKQNDNEQKKLDQLQTLPERNQKEIDESQKIVERHMKEKEELEATLEQNTKSLKNDTKPLQDEKEPLEKELGVLKASLDTLKADYTEAEKELEIIKKDETTEIRKYESLKNSFEDTKKQLEEKQETVEKLKEEIPQMKQQVVVKQEEVKALQQEEQDVAGDLRKVRMKLDESRMNMQVAQSNNKVLNALMKEKQKGTIPGILGRLGDLGAIDKQYDVAISTCCGRLDNIVVTDVETATRCIQFLKDHNVGRATFIALDKVAHYIHEYNKKKQYPQNVPRLVDLIKVEDERVLPAFYFSLFETLVARDMAQAREIAYGQTRYRVVTMNGEVIEISGTMSGGGRSKISGRMGQKVQTKSAPSRHSMSEKDIETLSAAAQVMQAKINDFQHRQGILEEELRKLNIAISQKEQELKRLILNVKSYAEQIPRLQEQLNRQKQKADSTKSDASKVADLEKKVTKCKASFEKKSEEVEEIQTKVNAINTQIKDISNKKIKEVQTKINKITQQIDKLTTNINKLTVEIRTTGRNIQKAEERIEHNKNEIAECEASLHKMAEERTECVKDSEELAKRVEDMKKELEGATKDSSSTKKEIVALQKEEADGKMKRLELDDKLKTIEKSLKEQAGKVPQWEKKIAALKLHKIPNEEMPNPMFRVYTEEELKQRKVNDTQYEITSLEEKLSVSKPNLGVIDDYNKKREAYLERINILEDVTLRRNEMREALDSVKKKRFQEFTEGFQIISRKLKEMYQMITLGGDAELELVDSMDPFSEGIVFSVRPPKKSWKVITNLSGGEKTLSSLALVFALHYYKPSPLYFMDEIDAALDFKNVSIVANYINERTKNAQFIIISLRSNMFELADYLVGIYKVTDCTQSVTVRNDYKEKEFGTENEKENQDENLKNQDTMISSTSSQALMKDNSLVANNSQSLEISNVSQN